MKSLSLRLVAVLAALVLPSAAQADDLVKIKFADLGATTNNLYEYLGLEKGIYKKHGLDLDFISFLKGGPEVIAAAASQQVDIGGLGTPILTGISRGIPIKVVGSPVLKGQEFVLVSRPDINSVNDLRGQTVGVSSVGGGQSQALKFILRASGLKDNDVKVVAYGSTANAYAVIKSGQVAAAVMGEPVISKSVLDGSGKILADAADYFGRYQHSYVFASDRFIAQHPDAIRAFFQADREAARYALDHHDELVAYGRKKLDLDDAVLNKIFDRTIPKWDVSLTVDREGLLNAVHIVQDLGDINKNYTPVFEQITDLRFVTPSTEQEQGALQ